MMEPAAWAEEEVRAKIGDVAGPREELSVVFLQRELDLDNDAEDRLRIDKQDHEVGAVLGRDDLREIGRDACLGVAA